MLSVNLPPTLNAFRSLPGSFRAWSAWRTSTWTWKVPRMPVRSAPIRLLEPPKLSPASLAPKLIVRVRIPSLKLVSARPIDGFLKMIGELEGSPAFASPPEALMSPAAAVIVKLANPWTLLSVGMAAPPLGSGTFFACQPLARKSTSTSPALNIWLGSTPFGSKKKR